METNKVICPDCGETLPLVIITKKPGRVAAYHACLGKGTRQVYETDAPDFPPGALMERIQQSEFGTPQKTRSKQK